MRGFLRPRKIVFRVVALAISLLLAEGLLQLTARVYPEAGLLLFPLTAGFGRLLNDKQLGHRGNPVFPGHDARGWRNAAALTSADIVALGNSHTYGVAVEAEEVWPYLLERKTGLATYNMGMGGYGTAHNFLQLESALALRPRLIIVAIYLGNDFWDNIKLALNHDTLGQTLDYKKRATLINLEQTDPISKRWSSLFYLNQ